jgi:hypothetical protein
MKTSKKAEDSHKKEIMRMRNRRKKQRTELERLRRLETFIQQTNPEKLAYFNHMDQSFLNTCGVDIIKNPETLWDHCTPKQEAKETDYLAQETGSPSQDINDALISEMCQTYNVHLNEFDSKLFENFY